MENKQMKCTKGKSCLHCGTNYCRFVDELDQLKAEFDKKELIFAGIETSNRLLIEKNNKLKQTLTEIKEIAEDFYLDGEHVKGKYLAQEILQKISEVEECKP